MEPGRTLSGDLRIDRRPAASQRLGEVRLADHVQLRLQRVQAVQCLEVVETTSQVVVETDEMRFAWPDV